MGTLLVEVITEAYDGKMITKHVLGGTDDAVRYAELGWTLVAVASSALLPLIFRRAASLGRILGDIASQARAVSAAERWGTHGLLWCAGAFQAAVVALLAITGGRRLWRYGLRSRG